MKVIVYHSGYGCETGWCGHWVQLDYEKDEGVKERFQFDHPYKDDDYKEYVRNLVTEEFGEDHVKDIDWDNCKIVFAEDCTQG